MYYSPLHTVRSYGAFPMPFIYLLLLQLLLLPTYFPFFGSVRSQRKTGRANDRDDGDGGWEDKEGGGACFGFALAISTALVTKLVLAYPSQAGLLSA